MTARGVADGALLDSQPTRTGGIWQCGPCPTCGMRAGHHVLLAANYIKNIVNCRGWHRRSTELAGWLLAVEASTWADGSCSLLCNLMKREEEELIPCSHLL